MEIKDSGWAQIKGETCCYNFCRNDFYAGSIVAEILIIKDSNLFLGHKLGCDFEFLNLKNLLLGK